MGKVGLLILGIILYLAISSSLKDWRSGRSGGGGGGSKKKGTLGTILVAREQTRAKRKLAADKERRKEKKEAKEAKKLARAQGKTGQTWFPWN